jgi:hypothetical protein
MYLSMLFRIKKLNVARFIIAIIVWPVALLASWISEHNANDPIIEMPETRETARNALFNVRFVIVATVKNVFISAF